MKKHILLFAIFFFAIGNAQQKKIDFKKKLSYELKITPEFQKDSLNKKQEKIFFESYTNGKDFLTSADVKNNTANFFTDENGTSMVTFGMNNTLIANKNNPLMMRSIFSEDEEVTQKFAASKLGTSETILGITCNNYILKPVFVDEKEKLEANQNLKLCVNENYGINNVPVLSSIYNSAGYNHVEFNISGLILKAGAEKKYNTDYLALKSIIDSKDYVYFDNKKSIADQKKFADSLKLEYKKMRASRDSISDSVAVADDYLDVEDYQSTYKKPVEGYLSISKFKDDDKRWKILPKYCRNLDKDLPQFDNAEIADHLKNYVGQMCDMYITQSDQETVDEKITLDEIRREVLYFIYQKKKISKSDWKKLQEYLNNLD